MSSAPLLMTVKRVPLGTIPRYRKGYRPARAGVRMRGDFMIATHADNSRYNGKTLRRLRAERGVGRPPREARP